MSLDNIPRLLKDLPQWVVVRRDSKIPLDAKTGMAASSVEPSTWSDFNTAHELVKDGIAGNVGFVFSGNDAIIGIDIDDGLDEEGFMSPLAVDIIGRCKSYTEKSRSGRGFHILLKGSLPFKGKNNLAGVEIYKSARYFIMTGDTMLYNDIIENQDAIDYVVQTYFPEYRDKEQSCYDGRIYSPVWELPENNRIKLRPVYPRIPDGSRNICLTSLAGMLHNIGYSKQAMLDELKYANITACEPPLYESELRSIVNSVTRYKR